ncbi:hypothetical protein M569_09440 [Genlisea aurea]|uniref:RING-type domain-containing protein n=1 Tax=Genlisea aurea TaxID=192259 RepID=S8CKY1_9LAMI|nr:hypothetical protein M569_09440 [Genlisea aurea]
MVLGWRKVFCTAVPDDGEGDSPMVREKSGLSVSIASRFSGIFSNPSTPRPKSRSGGPPAEGSFEPETPKLECKSKISEGLFNRSAPSSPRSPSTFSLLKSSLRVSKSRCGICLHGLRSGQGTAIFTAECGHSFHFPCISSQVRKQAKLTCPTCGFTWKEVHLLEGSSGEGREKRSGLLKVYNDDEPLSSPTSGSRFNPIPESDETEEEIDEFPGFFSAGDVVPLPAISRGLDVALLSEAAVVSVGKTSETYAIVLKLRAPLAPPRRVPVDLVVVLNVSRTVTAEKVKFMKKVMRMVISSLSAADRLSIVAFSTTSKRLLPLRRMSTVGRRSARRIIDAVVSLDGAATSATATESLKKAAKVIEDRREKNPATSILLFSDGHRSGPLVSSTRFTDLEIPVHYVNLSVCSHAPPDIFAERISGLLSQAIQDLRIQVGITEGSAPADISAVYAYTGKPAFLGSGSNYCWIGALHSEEERELLIELKVPSSLGGARRLLAVRCCYRDPSTQKTICDKERHLAIPPPRAVGSSTRDIQRLRCLFVTTRAVAESRRLVERNDVAGAHHMLASARALVLQSGSGSGSEFVRGLEAELAELTSKRQQHFINTSQDTSRADEKAEPLTPTSAWRAAERLAKVAIMKKSLNRVSDLHGFENARF